jgi:hypothetical protein
MKMDDSALSELVKSKMVSGNSGLSDAVIRALDHVKNFKPENREEYFIPFNQSLGDFRGVRLDWAFKDCGILPTNPKKP